MGIWLLVAAGVLALVALVVFVWAWRGRRVDDHPVCRGCGFDLTGRSEGSLRCAECGRDISKPRAVRVGHRRRRVWWAAGAGAVLASVLVALGTGGWAVGRKINLYPYKPVWMLKYELADSGLASWRAERELEKRVESGKLRVGDLNGTVEWVLRHQGDVKSSWTDQMGNLVVFVEKHGGLNDEQWRRFTRQSFSYFAVARSRVSDWGKLPIELNVTSRTADFFHVQAEGEVTILLMANGKSAEVWKGDVRGFIFAHQKRLGRVLVPVGLLGRAGDICDLQFRCKLKLSDPGGIFVNKKRFEEEVVEIDNMTRALVLPAGELSTNEKRGVELDAAITSAIQMKAFQEDIGNESMVYMNIEVKHSPEDLAYKIVMDDCDAKKLGSVRGTLLCRKGENLEQGYQMVGGVSTSTVPEEITVHLIPDAGLALESTSVLDYAGIELTYKVKVTKTRATTRPHSTQPAWGK